MRFVILAAALLFALAAEAALFRSGPVVIKNLEVESFDVSAAPGTLPDLGAPGDPPLVSVYLVRYQARGKASFVDEVASETKEALRKLKPSADAKRGSSEWIVSLPEQLAKAGLKLQSIGISAVEGGNLASRPAVVEVELEANGELRALSADGAEVPLHSVVALDNWKFEPPPAELVGKKFRIELPVNGILNAASGLDVEPMIVRKPRFAYPRSEMFSGIDGEVEVTFTVGFDGKVESAYLSREDHPAFNEEVLEKIWDYEFTPGLVNGKPARYTFMQPLVFRSPNGGQRTFRIVGSSKEMPEAFRFDVRPEPKSMALAAYPFNAIIERRTGLVDVLMLISGDGSVIEALGEGKDPELVHAAVAAAEASTFEPAKRDGKAVSTLLNRKFRFSIHGQHDTLTTTDERGIATLLRRKSINLIPFAQLDKPIAPLVRHPPVMPTRVVLSEPIVANVEVIIDEEGRVNLPRVVNQIDPKFAASAVHALKRWTFQPPMKGGEAVMTKVVVPVRFSPPKSPEQN